MKKFFKEMKQSLCYLLVAALLVGMVPTNTLAVRANEGSQVSGNEAGQVSGNVSDNDDGNVSDNDDGNVSDNDDGNVSDNDDGNVSDNDDGNVSDNDDGNVSDNDDGNVSDNDDGNVSDNDDGNVSDNDDGNVSDNDDGNVSDNDDGNISDNDDGNVSDNDDGNVSDNEGDADDEEEELPTTSTVYETKLQLTKGTTNIYTGQKDILIATAKYSKNTTWKKLKQQELSWQNGKVVSRVQGDKIYLTVAKGAAAGKISIPVMADAPETMMNSTATVTVNILQGIETITVNAPKVIYKADKKAVSFTPSVTYNENTWTVPKIKKVQWSLVKDTNGTPLGAEDEIAKFVTVNPKNGKVTINKNYTPAQNASFYLKAEAADCARTEENQVIGYSEAITISAEKTQLGKVVIVNRNNEVVTEGNSTLFPDQIGGTRVAVLKDAAKEAPYTEADFVDSDLITFKSSNKSLVIDKEGNIYHSGKVVKNAKITVTAKDGSKAGVILNKLNITYTDAKEIALVIHQKEGDIYHSLAIGAAPSEAINFYGPKDTIFYVRMIEKQEDGSWKEIRGEVNHSLKIKGGSIGLKSLEYPCYYVKGTSDTITFTLENKAQDAINAKQVYTLKNVSLGSGKKIKVDVSSNTLNLGKEQLLTEKKTVYYYLPDALSQQEEITHAYITLDSTAYLKTSDYETLAYLTKTDLNSPISLWETYTYDQWVDGRIEQVEEKYLKDLLTITVDPQGNSIHVPKGNYKINIHFGKLVDGKFVALTAPTPQTIKVTNKEPYVPKLENNYTIHLKSNLSTYIMDITNAVTKNDNIKGKENRFWDFFEIVTVPYTYYTDTYLQLKEGVKVEDIKKEDLTGWITQYEYAGKVYNNPTKIKVTLKDSYTGKFYIPELFIYKADVMEGSTDITCYNAAYEVSNLNPVKVFTDDKIFTAAIEEQLDGWSGKTNRQVVLKTTGDKVKKSHNVKIYVIPERSYYKDMEIKNLKDAKKYGIPVTIKVKVGEVTEP